MVYSQLLNAVLSVEALAGVDLLIAMLEVLRRGGTLCRLLALFLELRQGLKHRVNVSV